MYKNLRVGAVVPARNEEDNIGAVVRELVALRDGEQRLLDDFVVCDNGSTDDTAQRARIAGARVVCQESPGYGIACLTAIDALEDLDVVLFTDGDGSFDARQSLGLLAAVAAGADLVVGSRALGRMEPGALSLAQRGGNRLASLLIRLLWARRVTDLGPYRAIRADALQLIDMRDTAYGWTIEMQIKAIQCNLRIVEVPVDTYRRRFGKSKVGGTLRGVLGAGAGILWTIAKLRCRRQPGAVRGNRTSSWPPRRRCLKRQRCVRR